MVKFQNILIIFTSIFILYGCSTNGKKSWKEIVQLEKDTKASSSKNRKPIIKSVSLINIEEEKDEQYIQPVTNKQSSVKKPIQEIPLELIVEEKKNLNLHYNQKKFNFWVKYFTKRDPKRFQRHMSQGKRFKKLTSRIFKKHNLPVDLYYVGLIESGFNTKIRSRANAVGPWQFIKGTATRYGLRVDSLIDERRNIHKSTVAAAKYFKDLYNIFGSWELALCAYNSGEYRIIRAIRKGNTRDYLELVKKGLLPKETVYYVPKIAAARYLNNNLKKYNYNLKKLQAKLYTKAVSITLKRSFKPEVIRKLIGQSRSTFRLLNPDIKSSFIRVYRKPFNLMISADKFKNASKISRYMVRPLKRKKKSVAKSKTRLKRKKVVRRGKINFKRKYHRVKKGETLYSIGRKYGLTLSKIKKINKLKSNKIFFGKKLKVNRFKVYIVKRGDNLTKIAKRFSIPIRKLLSVNSLKSKKIFPRQQIFIPI